MFDLEYLARTVHRERILNIEEHLLMKEALVAQERDKKDPFYYEALAALGRRMSAWGEHLQQQYDHAAQMPVDAPFGEVVRE